MQTELFRFDGSLRNNNFQSWRLGRAVVRGQSTLQHERCIWATALDGPELIKSLQTSFHNNLFTLHERAYFFSCVERSISLCFVSLDEEGLSISHAAGGPPSTSCCTAHHTSISLAANWKHQARWCRQID
jgi:hypothetical protein